MDVGSEPGVVIGITWVVSHTKIGLGGVGRMCQHLDIVVCKLALLDKPVHLLLRDGECSVI